MEPSVRKKWHPSKTTVTNNIGYSWYLSSSSQKDILNCSQFTRYQSVIVKANLSTDRLWTHNNDTYSCFRTEYFNVLIIYSPLIIAGRVNWTYTSTRSCVQTEWTYIQALCARNFLCRREGGRPPTSPSLATERDFTSQANDRAPPGIWYDQQSKTIKADRYEISGNY